MEPDEQQELPGEAYTILRGGTTCLLTRPNLMLGALLATVMPCCALVGAGRGATGDDKVHAAAQVSFQARLFSLDGDRCSH